MDLFRRDDGNLQREQGSSNHHAQTLKRVSFSSHATSGYELKGGGAHRHVLLGATIEPQTHSGFYNQAANVQERVDHLVTTRKEHEHLRTPRKQSQINMPVPLELIQQRRLRFSVTSAPCGLSHHKAYTQLETGTAYDAIIQWYSERQETVERSAYE